MSKTKEKILTEALYLFNKNGLTEVSLRTISDALNISVGNLQYHFKKREHIVEALYFKLVETIDYDVDRKVSQDISLVDYVELNYRLAKAFFEYRFFFLEFVAIIRNHENIKIHYRQLTLQREEQFLDVMKHFVLAGIVRAEEFVGEFRYLYQHTEIVSNFWLSNLSLKISIMDSSIIDEHVKMMVQCLSPYLTAKEKSLYPSDFGCLAASMNISG